MLLFLRVEAKSEIKAQVLGYPSQRNEKYHPLKINDFFFPAKCMCCTSYVLSNAIHFLSGVIMLFDTIRDA